MYSMVGHQSSNINRNPINSTMSIKDGFGYPQMKK